MNERINYLTNHVETLPFAPSRRVPLAARPRRFTHRRSVMSIGRCVAHASTARDRFARPVASFAPTTTTRQRARVSALRAMCSSDRADAPPAHAPSFYSKAMQSVNAAGIKLFIKSTLTDRALAMPQVACRDASEVDWAHLKALGFKGVIFDKDNTLTTPYAMEINDRVRRSLESCKEAFGEKNVAVYSNSAGLYQYDPDGKEADAMERALGVRFVRHATKKPAGDVDDVVENFPGCNSARELIFVGDRYLTDVVFGNRHGMFTIRVEPFTLSGESLSIRAARKIEESVVALWRSLGVAPRPHERLFPGGVSLDAQNRAHWTLIDGEPAAVNLSKVLHR